MLLNGVTWNEGEGGGGRIRISQRFHPDKERREEAERQTSSMEGSGIAIDFAGWKMNIFFLFLSSLPMYPCVCVCV